MPILSPLLPQDMNKSRIAHCFTQAQGTYDHQAFAQKNIAQTLSQKIKEKVQLADHAKIWEFGCGTGDFSHQLLQHFTRQEATLNDLTPLSQTCLEKLSAHSYTFKQGDMEQISLKENTWDLICGSSAIQWFSDIPQFIERCKQALKPGGFLAFSSFLPHNLIQIKKITGVGLQYLEATDWELLLRDFDVLVFESDQIDLLFDTPLAILKHLKETGVNGISQQQWTPNKLKHFVEAYTERYSQQGQVRLTYHPIYIIAQKRNK